MEYVQLPGTNMRVSRVALGCEPLGGTDWGAFDSGAAIAAVQKAYDRGVTFFDTADVYGLGRSEELLARALGESRRDVVIASKGGVRWEQPGSGARARTWRDASGTYITEALEGTLRRLRIECLPLYYLHWPDPGTPIDQTMEALLKCRQVGKLQNVGVSNFSAHQLEQAHRCLPLAAVQVEYNLLAREAADEVIPTCRRLGIGIVAYGPLAQGLLTGKFGAGASFDPSDRRHRLRHFRDPGFAATRDTVQAVESIAAASGRSPAQVALRWVLESSGIVAAVAGAKTPHQADDNAGACGWRLSTSDYRHLTDVTQAQQQ